MADQIKSGREYSELEIKAMRRLGRLKTLDVSPPSEGRGPAYFATARYYPELLTTLAKSYEQAAQDARLVAAALRREFEKWPEKAGKDD